jgi:hypothetical protein
MVLLERSGESPAAAAAEASLASDLPADPTSAAPPGMLRVFEYEEENFDLKARAQVRVGDCCFGSYRPGTMLLACAGDHGAGVVLRMGGRGGGSARDGRAECGQHDAL